MNVNYWAGREKCSGKYKKRKIKRDKIRRGKVIAKITKFVSFYQGNGGN